MGKLSRLITVTAVAAATGAGVYYYLNKNQMEAAKNVDESGEGISGTGTTAQDSVTDFFREKREAIMSNREYVNITENVSAAKNTLIKTVSEAAEKIKEKAAEMKDGVGVVADDVKDTAEDFEFEQFEDEDIKESFDKEGAPEVEEPATSEEA